MTKNTTRLLTVISFLFALVFFLFAQFSKAQGGSLRVYFFDVGQGDAILIRTPDNKDILIDGGPDDMVLERINEALPFWDRYIDIVILTHPHDDHIAGLNDVLDCYSVGKVLEPDLIYEPENMIYFNSKAENEEGAVAGERIVLGQDLEMEFFYPLNIELDEKDLNDTSLVFQLRYKDKKLLFTGDATSKVEAKIIGQNIDSDILKVGHHGSRYSSSVEFLEAVSPTISIISVGEGNSFGHPTQETLDRLQAVGSRVLRTDENGTVEVEVGGDGGWKIGCRKGCG